MDYKNLLTDLTDGILTVTINRPDKLNALNRETIREIGKVVQLGVENRSVKVIVLTGSGNKAFVAGADISEFASYESDEGQELSAQGHIVFNEVEACPKPVIAAINGFALGGGCELAMACHLRIASDTAQFGQPEVKLGLIPGYGGTQRLPLLIGKSKAMELLMTGDRIDAAEALRLGLVSALVPSAELMSYVRTLALKIAGQAPLAIAEIIRTVNACFAWDKDGFQEEIERFGACFDTLDFKEGTEAFLAKRKPEFKGE